MFRRLLISSLFSTIYVIKDYPQLTGYFTIPLSSDRICYGYAELTKVPVSADHLVRSSCLIVALCPTISAISIAYIHSRLLASHWRFFFATTSFENSFFYRRHSRVIWYFRSKNSDFPSFFMLGGRGKKRQGRGFSAKNLQPHSSLVQGRSDGRGRPGTLQPLSLMATFGHCTSPVDSYHQQPNHTSPFKMRLAIQNDMGTGLRSKSYVIPRSNLSVRVTSMERE